MGKCESALVSCDYVTATATTDSQVLAFEMMATTWLTDKVLNGYSPKAWKFYGYEGWRTEGFSYGVRFDGAILRAWGDFADSVWREIVVSAHNITRLDICVDCLCLEQAPDIGIETYAMLGHVDTTYKTALIQGSDGGQTFYLGSRTSERFGRLYDKGVEQKSHKPGHLWRYEVELKGNQAYRVSRALLLSDFDDQITQMGFLVYDFFDLEGANVLFPRIEAAYVTRPYDRKKYGDDVLEWLRRQVSPSVKRLVSVGRLSDVLEALGLENV